MIKKDVEDDCHAPAADPQVREHWVAVDELRHATVHLQLLAVDARQCQVAMADALDLMSELIAAACGLHGLDVVLIVNVSCCCHNL